MKKSFLMEVITGTLGPAIWISDESKYNFEAK